MGEFYRKGSEELTLWSQFLTNDRRVIHKWTHYFPAYEAHFSRYVNRPVTMLELGCGDGGSLQMWKRYLGPRAQIIGVDFVDDSREFEEDQIAVRIGFQHDTEFLATIVEEFGPLDIVLDDASHVMKDTIESFRFLYPRMDKAGVYMVEDMHTSYWDEFGGGLRRPDSFIELSKSLIDELNADHTRGASEPTEFTKSTLSMHFYDSVVVFERGASVTKRPLKIGEGVYREDAWQQPDL